MSAARLTDTVAIVTGSATGIGRATAKRFADEGAAVVIADVNDDDGLETRDAILDDGGEAIFVETDVTDRTQVASMVDRTVDEFGGVDVLMNNAGGAFDDDNVHRIDEEIWTENIRVNLTGAFICTKAALPEMVDGGGGSVIHTSSVNGQIGLGLPAYSAAKGGLIPFSRVLANQYGRHGIRSNAICPGEIDTEAYEYTEWGDDVVEEWLDQFPLGRFGEPEDVANVALFLASDESAYVTGTEIVVDGGFTAGPNYSLENVLYDLDERPT